MPPPLPTHLKELSSPFQLRPLDPPTSKMCRSIQENFTCGCHLKPRLERCALEFEEGHTLNYGIRDFDHPCPDCRTERKLRKRIEEHKQKIEELQRAEEADDESEGEERKVSTQKTSKRISR